MLRSLRLSFAVLACCAATSVHAAASGLQLSERLQPASDPTITPVIAIPELHLKLPDRASARLVSAVVLRNALAMPGTDHEFGSNDADPLDPPEEPRLGTDCVSTRRSRRPPHPQKQTPPPPPPTPPPP